MSQEHEPAAAGIAQAGETAVDDGSELPRLTPAEDAEMRQLAWFAKAGNLSEKSQARLSELRARDRRKAIRDPRPDPSSGSTGPATLVRAEAAGPAACPNCGCGPLRSAKSSSSCPNCGFSVRLDDWAVPDPAPAPATSGRGDLPGFDRLDKPGYLELLLSAAKGGTKPDDS